MATYTKSFYPTSVSQTTGGKYRPFKDLAVIENAGNGYAESNGNILGKKSSPNRPSTIDATKFNCKLPLGAIVTNIRVEVRHRKTGESNKKSCNIPAPTISLLYNGHIAYTTKASNGTFSYSKKAQAPKYDISDASATWNGTDQVEIPITSSHMSSTLVNALNQAGASKKETVKYPLLSRNVVNDNSFGVRVNYPTNTNNYVGKMRVWWVRVSITYTTSAYTLKMGQVTSNDTGYNNEDYRVNLLINRTSNTDYVPTVTITTPDGFTFKEAYGGSVEKISNHIFKWTPNLSSSVGASTSNVHLLFGVSVTYSGGATSYDGTFEATESLNNATVTHTAHITDRPQPISIDTTGTEDIGTVKPEDAPVVEDDYITVRRTETCYLNLNLTDTELEAWNTTGNYLIFTIKDEENNNITDKFRHNSAPITRVDSGTNLFELTPTATAPLGKCSIKIELFVSDENILGG